MLDVLAFAGGYLLIWIAYSTVAVVVHRILADRSLLTPMMEASSSVFGGGLLLLVGIYQFTPYKTACLRACCFRRRAPEFRFTGVGAGGLVSGAASGLCCVGCCGMLMLLLFVGGVMSLAWNIGLTLLVFVERAMPLNSHTHRVIGIGLIGTGAWQLLRATH